MLNLDDSGLMLQCVLILIRVGKSFYTTSQALK